MKRTPLWEAHRALGARFVDFGGWEMPVQYDGILAEHAAVRGAAGLFDVSHMGEIELRGPHAIAAAQHLTANDVGALVDGRAQYSLLLLPNGGIVDAGKEMERVEREIKKADKNIAALEKKLGSKGFAERAPEEVVAEAKDELAREKERRALLDEARALAAELTDDG